MDGPGNEMIHVMNDMGRAVGYIADDVVTHGWARKRGVACTLTYGRPTMYITDEVSSHGWAQQSDEPCNECYGQAHRRMRSQPINVLGNEMIHTTNHMGRPIGYIADGVVTQGWAHRRGAACILTYGRPTRYIMDEVSTNGWAHAWEDLSNKSYGQAHQKIVPVTTNGQGLWDISNPIKSKQQASPWVGPQVKPNGQLCCASPRRLSEAKPRWMTHSLSIWHLSSQPMEVSAVAIIDDSKAVDPTSGANSCHAICQYMMARLHEEIVDGLHALPEISIPMQIACKVDHIVAVII
ncbi:hypothetical protein BKA82DRAFT_4017280 [Pisolithus tinctorius]|nr:hypothetical protein BKA82DRAFT_4017280 [Pisolithus tinctorius]